MALFSGLLFKAFVYGVTIAYPAFKANEALKEGKIQRLWIVYFVIIGLLSLLQYTLLYPVVLL